MVDIFRADARTNTLNPGRDWNPFLREVEALSNNRIEAMERAAQYVLSTAMNEDLAADLATTAHNFAEAVQPPLSPEEHESFTGVLSETVLVQRAIQAVSDSLERLAA